jgi:hypothetical protein
MAKVYLAAASPEFALRTWTDVMEKYVTSGAESSKDRKERAFRSRPYVGLHKLKLIDTAAEHLFAVLEHQKAGNSTHHYLRRLHNFALHLGWLLAPVMSDEEIARMEQEMKAVEPNFKAVEQSYGENVLNITLARGYVKKLLLNAKVVRFLTSKHPDIYSEFEAVAAMETL